MTDQQSIRAGFKLGLDRAGSGPGLARHMACCGVATSRPWAFTGLRFRAVGVSVAHGGPRDAGPWTVDRSTVDRVHHLFPRLGPRAPSIGLRCSTCPFSSVSSTARSRRRRTHRRASAAVLAPNWHGKKHRQALATAMVVSGRQLGLPRSLATANGGSSTTGVRGVARVQRHRLGLWCA